MSTESDRRHAIIEVPKGVSFTVDGKILRAKGPLGAAQRPFPSDILELKVAKGTATLTLLLPPTRKASQALLGTWAAHVRNLAAGLTLGVEAKLKVVAAHFPMKVQVRGEELVIDNFLGEKYPGPPASRPAPRRPSRASSWCSQVTTWSRSARARRTSSG